MSDQIPRIDTQDRANLNVTGAVNNKSLIIGAFSLFGVVVIAGAIAFVFNSAKSADIATQAPPINEINYAAGFEKSSLKDSDAYFNEMEKAHQREKALEKERLANEWASREAARLAAEKTQAEKNKKNKPVTVQRVSNTPARQPIPRATVASSSTKNAPLTPLQRKKRGAVMVDLGGSQSATSNLPRDLDNRFNAPAFAAGSATLRGEGALDFMLIHGTAIPCALYTQIISDYEGFVTCRVTQDIYSANGAALLVERGSMVSGTQNVAMEQGKARIFTNWADIETPLGVSIRIDSLGTGALGASGHEAWVDNHFSERFGGAIMLSFVDDALGALSDQASDGDVQFDNSTENAGDMASKALESSINIAPTGYSYIGQRINILIARDIDMSSIYQFGATQ